MVQEYNGPEIGLVIKLVFTRPIKPTVSSLWLVITLTHKDQIRFTPSCFTGAVCSRPVVFVPQNLMTSEFNQTENERKHNPLIYKPHPKATYENDISETRGLGLGRLCSLRKRATFLRAAFFPFGLLSMPGQQDKQLPEA